MNKHSYFSINNNAGIKMICHFEKFRTTTTCKNIKTNMITILFCGMKNKRQKVSNIDHNLVCSNTNRTVSVYTISIPFIAFISKLQEYEPYRDY